MFIFYSSSNVSNQYLHEVLHMKMYVEGTSERNNPISMVSCPAHLNYELQGKDPASPLLDALNNNYTALLQMKFC